MLKVASWNLNSVRSRLTHVTTWLKAREPDMLLLQELKGMEFPSEAFKTLGYDSVAVTQKAYNGVAILSLLIRGKLRQHFPFHIAACGLQGRRGVRFRSR